MLTSGVFLKKVKETLTIFLFTNEFATWRCLWDLPAVYEIRNLILTNQITYSYTLIMNLL